MEANIHKIFSRGHIMEYEKKDGNYGMETPLRGRM
jgi:hypothetical protein